MVSLAALIPGDPPSIPGWERLDADVDADQARRRARDALKNMQHGDEVVTATEFTVHASHFVVHPVWLARYHYRGAAAPDGGTYHVGILGARRRGHLRPPPVEAPGRDGQAEGAGRLARRRVPAGGGIRGAGAARDAGGEG